jgi:Fe2+ transport system protein FeoA
MRHKPGRVRDGELKSSMNPQGGLPHAISDLENGQEFVVVGVTLEREIGKRLADMGFVRGTRGKVVRSALLGDPLQVKIMDYDISIRRAEAAGVVVEIVGKEPVQ